MSSQSLCDAETIQFNLQCSPQATLRNASDARPTAWSRWFRTHRTALALFGQLAGFAHLVAVEHESEGLDVPVRSYDPVELREAWQTMDEILRSMTTRKREVFIVGELEERSCAEIARIVGAKEATVWSRLHYARREFADKLARLRQRALDVAESA